MQSPALVRTAGWITLGALIALAPQITACDTDPKHTTKGASAASAPPSAIIPPGPTTTTANDSGGDKAAAPQEESKPASTAEPKVDRTPDATGTLKVKRLVIASGVEKREPLEITAGKVAEPILAFVELAYDGAQEAGVLVTFEHENGKKVGFVQLNVPAESPRYRTWARTRNIDEPGTWTAIVSSEDGQELARKAFIVTG